MRSVVNIFLWVLQALMAFHTATGAVWKFSNSEQAVPTLEAIPHGAWLGLGVIELVCAVALVLPAIYAPSGKAMPFAAAFVVAEMLLFTGLHVASGATDKGPVVYWLVVAAICGFLAYGRFALKPLGEAARDQAKTMNESAENLG
jgi:DoxX-like family